MRIIATSLLVPALISTILSSHVSAAKYDPAQDALVDTKTVYDAQRNELGTKHIVSKKNVVTSANGTTVITIKTQSEIQYKTLAKEPHRESKTKVIKITKDGRYFINGKELSQAQLQQTFMPLPDGNSLIPYDPTGSSSTYNGEEGGKYHLTWYDEQSLDYFFLRAYPDADYFMDNATGSLLAKMRGGSYNVTSYKNYAMEVSNNRDDIVQNGVQLASMLGISAISLTMGNVIGALGAAGAAGWLAWAVDSASGDGHDAMANAYIVLQKL